MQYVYVLLNQSGQFYTGCTSDLKKRMNEHSSGKSLYTKHHGPYELIYYEACIDVKDGYAREKYLKSGMGKRYLRNRMKKYLEGERMNPVRAQQDNKSLNKSEDTTQLLCSMQLGKISEL